MIIIYHKNNKVHEIWHNTSFQNIPPNENSISKQILVLAERYPNELLVWCSQQLKEELNNEELKSICHNKRIVASYNVSEENYLPDAIGYVNESPFININKEVIYPTWLMSSDVGIINSEALLMLKGQLVLDSNFDYFLNSLAKLVMPLGLFCYSNPKLLKEKVDIKKEKSNRITLFRFVKQHYKPVWIFLLFIDFILYEKKFPLLPLLFSLFYKKRTINEDVFKFFDEEYFGGKTNEKIEIDVIIPTIGRKDYLYNTLKDLSKQTLHPKQIIIVEQNPELNSKTELDYLELEKWPFKIKHHFTHQTGACNARNMALQDADSNWVFLADDDIVLEADFLEKANKIIKQSKHKAFTFNCHLKDELPVFSNRKQWNTFGSGCSIVNRESMKGSLFSMAFEHGFGEDADFGMQLRNKGVDVIYLPKPSILHLKAPIGGFRIKPHLAWKDDSIQPKPSPTVMLFLQTHHSSKQILGYKTILFFKYYNHQNIKNPFIYYKTFIKQWKRSQFWAKNLKEQLSL